MSRTVQFGQILGDGPPFLQGARLIIRLSALAMEFGPTIGCRSPWARAAFRPAAC